jgi:hypothetical protein
MINTMKQIRFFTVITLSFILLSTQYNQQLQIKKMTMIFEGYDEGDFPHLLFFDIKTKEQYDFGHILENQLGNSKILLSDPGSSFGYKSNPKYIGKKFVVLAFEKYFTSTDEDGKRIKNKEWVIKSINQIP